MTQTATAAGAARAQRRGILYFDNAATSWPKAPGVAEGIVRFLEKDAANPGRSAHPMAAATHAMIASLRERLADMIHAPTRSRVVITAGCTDALNLAFHAYFGAGAQAHCPWRSGLDGVRPKVVTTMLEHKAVRRPLADLVRRGLIDVDVVDCDAATGVLDPERILARVDERTAMVAMTQVSNVVGTIQPVEAVGRGLRAMDSRALLLVDAAQSMGALPIDVQALHADFLAFPGHKGLLGPTGIGGLYISPRAFPDSDGAERMITLRQGGTGGGTDTLEMPRALPRRFEAGTPNTVGCAGLLGALETAPDGALEHERRCAERLIEWAQGRDDVRVVGTDDVAQRTGVVLLVFEGKPSEDAAAELSARFSVACRAGEHCAPDAHRAMGTHPDGGVRIAPGPYTSEEEMERLIEALEGVAG